MKLQFIVLCIPQEDKEHKIEEKIQVMMLAEFDAFFCNKA